jgi:hypothetical protein
MNGEYWEEEEESKKEGSKHEGRKEVHLHLDAMGIVELFIKGKEGNWKKRMKGKGIMEDERQNKKKMARRRLISKFLFASLVDGTDYEICNMYMYM